MAQPDHICCECKELFSQPKREPGTQDCWEDASFAGWKRQGRDVLEAADSGCSLCRIVWNEASSRLGSRTNVEEAVIGPKICWGHETGAFCGLVYRMDTPAHVYPEILTSSRHIRRTSTGEGTRVNMYSFLDTHWFRSISRAPLNGRGWVFQERSLSPRTLHFSSQLFWECRTLKACETYPCGLLSEPSILGDDVDQSFPGSTKDWRNGFEKGDVDYWELIVQMFCRCYLTKSSDRLAAIAGMASQASNLLNDEYLAGVWKRQLPHGLLWKLENMVGQDDLIITRPAKYRGE